MGYRVHYDESMELWIKDFNHIFRHLSVSSVYSYYLGSSKAISVVPVPDSVHCTVINHTLCILEGTIEFCTSINAMFNNIKDFNNLLDICLITYCNADNLAHDFMSSCPN